MTPRNSQCLQISPLNCCHELTDDVDCATSDDSPLATNGICDIPSGDGSEEGTGRQDGDDERVVRAGKRLDARALDDLDEDRRARHTVDVTGVVAEEHATERGEGAHEVRLEGDGRLDGGDIAGRSDSRHDAGGGCVAVEE